MDTLSGVVVVTYLLARVLFTSLRPDAGGFLLIGLVVIGLSAAGGWWLKEIAREEHP